MRFRTNPLSSGSHLKNPEAERCLSLTWPSAEQTMTSVRVNCAMAESTGTEFGISSGPGVQSLKEASQEWTSRSHVLLYSASLELRSLTFANSQQRFTH